MLEKIDLTKKLSKEDYKAQIEPMQLELGKLQRKLKELNIPAMIVFEGYGAAGKGTRIASLIEALDPRGFIVYAVKNETAEEAMYPFMRRFWTKLPQRGRIALYDSSWYRKVLNERFDGKTGENATAAAYHSIRSFEEQLICDGMAMVKIFLTIDKKEQKKRLNTLLEDPATAWRVSKGDIERNKHFDRYTRMCEEMLKATDTEIAPWNIVESNDRRFSVAKIYQIVINALSAAIKEKEEGVVRKGRPEPAISLPSLEAGCLSNVDLTKQVPREEYKEELKKLQAEIQELHGQIYRKRIPVVLGFEGWDAAGKGGAIKRLTEKMDPRGYKVCPTSAANDAELAYQYLWRFWREMPKAGHIAIFDRTWYGRVMVERIEGFCTDWEWQRAYREINEMEEDLTDFGAIVIKFWMQIDKDEQERRFLERQNNPDKQWKITDEDWRNREKWDKYVTAVDEMLIRTSTPNAPWIVVEAQDKLYARLKVLKTVVEAIKERL